MTTSTTPQHAKEPLKNWAGNITYHTDRVYYPDTVEAVREIVRACEHLKVLGTRHCFNRIADSKHNLLSTSKLNKIVSLDEKEGTVTVEAGITYGELAPFLHERGFALHNLASLPHISVAGACLTATHGSGIHNGNMATAVEVLQMVRADGSLLELSRKNDGEAFLGAVVSLGALGVVTTLTLRLQPTYAMHQRVFIDLPLKALQQDFESIVSSGYSLSLFTDWQRDCINEVWIKSRMDSPDLFSHAKDFFGATLALGHLHPIAEMPAENCTEQMGLCGHWYERLPHFKMGFTPSSGVELQSEYFVPLRHGAEAIMAVHRLGKKIGPHLLISEIRTIAEDDLWLSPCRNQPSLAIHFTWKQQWDAVKRLLPEIEQELTPFKARPHWGKLFTLPANELARRYDKMDDFRSLVMEFDPKGKFRNDFLNTTIMEAAEQP